MDKRHNRAIQTVGWDTPNLFQLKLELTIGRRCPA
jgi:hypothetical protein